MARRSKDSDLVGLVVQLAGLVLLIGMISPQGRQLLSAFGAMAFVILGIAFLGLIAFAIFRFATRSKRFGVASASPFATGHAVSIPRMVATPRSAVALAPGVRSGSAIAQTQGSKVDLIQQLRCVDWFQFEKVVALAYRKQGYTVTRRGGANPDGGIDLVINKDDETQAVQCKQWRTWNVGVKPVREFLGALTHAQIQKGIIITLRGYTGEAKQLADAHKITIANETGLAAMLASTDGRFDPEVLEILRDTRKFCPKCEREMRLKTATKGVGTGNKFWGCSAFPKCRFTMPVAS